MIYISFDISCNTNHWFDGSLTTFWSIDHVTNWLQYFLPECNAVELRGGAVSEDLLDLEVWPRVEEDRRVVSLLGHGEHGLVGVNL